MFFKSTEAFLLLSKTWKILFYCNFVSFCFLWHCVFIVFCFFGDLYEKLGPFLIWERWISMHFVMLVCFFETRWCDKRWRRKIIDFGFYLGLWAYCLLSRLFRYWIYFNLVVWMKKEVHRFWPSGIKGRWEKSITLPYNNDNFQFKRKLYNKPTFEKAFSLFWY